MGNDIAGMNRAAGSRVEVTARTDIERIDRSARIEPDVVSRRRQIAGGDVASRAHVDRVGACVGGIDRSVRGNVDIIAAGRQRPGGDRPAAAVDDDRRADDVAEMDVAASQRFDLGGCGDVARIDCLAGSQQDVGADFGVGRLERSDLDQAGRINRQRLDALEIGGGVEVIVGRDAEVAGVEGSGHYRRFVSVGYEIVGMELDRVGGQIAAVEQQRHRPLGHDIECANDGNIAVANRNHVGRRALTDRIGLVEEVERPQMAVGIEE